MIKPPIPLKRLFIVDIFKDLYLESLFVFSRHENNKRCCDYFYYKPIEENINVWETKNYFDNKDKTT